MKRLNTSILLFLIFPISLVAQNETTPSSTTEKITLTNLSNCYKINNELYRSEQPDNKGMHELQSMGIVTVLNLRNIRSDKQEISGTDLIALHCPINTWTISYQDIRAGLIMLRDCKKPAVIHCKHGSDRTGCIVAAYRMAYEGWSREDAIAEFTDPRFGYHDGWFPNILKLLQTIDIDQLKAELYLTEQMPSNR